jgi:hypothetical protein
MTQCRLADCLDPATVAHSVLTFVVVMVVPAAVAVLLLSKNNYLI